MKPSLIVDCSVTMAWLFDDEQTAETSQIQDRLASEAAVVPVHWLLEVANVLALAERRKRISAATSHEFIQLLNGLEFEIDHDWKMDRSKCIPRFVVLLRLTSCLMPLIWNSQSGDSFPWRHWMIV
ncbi:MAG: type II toxin-antitoxin system VapC family toxin [Planctomycetales bacterium]